MKKLLYKELRLCVPAQCLIYACMSILVFIPTWPTPVAFIYPLASLSIVFPLSLANRDMLYTGILPVKKEHIVLGKVLLIGALEIFSMLVSLPFALLRLALFSDFEYSGLGVSFALYGFIFIAYSIFNIIFFPWYYKKPDAKNALCTIISDLAASTFLMIVMVCFLLFPEASSFLSSLSGWGLFAQLALLFGGIGVFLLTCYLSYRLGYKSFRNFDL